MGAEETGEGETGVEGFGEEATEGAREAGELAGEGAAEDDDVGLVFFNEVGEAEGDADGDVIENGLIF